MRPSKSELIELLSRVLVGVVVTPEGYLTEVALAGVLGADPRRLKAIRIAGIVSPRRLGRGFVYTGPEARACSVASCLIGLGVEIEEIAAFLERPCETVACRDGGVACAAHDCCTALLGTLAKRVESELGELRRFQNGLQDRCEPLLAEANRTAGEIDDRVVQLRPRTAARAVSTRL